MAEDLTIISSNNLSFIRQQRHTPREMVEFLKNGAMIRSFSGMLEALRPGENVAALLTDGLTEITGDNRASVSKKVRNWMAGRNLPKDRETVFRICFILQLSEAEANRLIGRLSDTGIHYRNPAELARAFALRTGRSYQEALQLSNLAEELTLQAQTAAGAQEEQEVYTWQFIRDFSDVDTEEKFRAFFLESGANLGQMHRTAYRYFKRMLALLQNPEHESAWTLTDVMREYMQMHVPAQQKKQSRRKDAVRTGQLDVLQKMVRLYWPGETSLSRMQTQAEDVSRKTLLLLYLATEAFDGGAEDDGAWLYEDLEEDRNAMLEVRIEEMNLFLSACGMNLLDPGSPFDLLLLYAMKTEEDEEARLRMEEVLEILFAEE